MTKSKVRNAFLVFALILVFACAMVGCKQAEPPKPPAKPDAAAAPAAAPPAEPAGPSPTQGVTDTEILIGTWGPQTGPASSWGAVSKGVEAYFAMINDQGGVHGRKLKLLIRDDGYMPPRTVAAAKELVEQEKVFCFVGGVGTATGMAIMQYLDDKQMVNVGPASGASVWANPLSKYRFGVYPSYTIESRLLVKYAAETLGKKKIAMFYQNDAFGKEGLNGVEKACGEFGVELITKVPYELSDTDLSSQALKIKGSGADTVILWATAKHAATFVKEAAKIAFKPQFLSSSTLSDPVMFKLAGDVWNGIIIANWPPMIDDPSPAVQKYKEALKKFAPDQKVGNFTLVGFVLAEPLVEGLRRAGKDLTTDGLINAMNGIKGFNGDYVHDLSYAPDDHVGIKSIYFIQGKGGKLEKISDWLK